VSLSWRLSHSEEQKIISLIGETNFFTVYRSSHLGIPALGAQVPFNLASFCLFQNFISGVMPLALLRPGAGKNLGSGSMSVP
jgi:hypothetical protein